MPTKATKRPRKPIKPPTFDSDADTAMTEEEDIGYDTVDSGDDVKSGMRESAGEGDSTMTHESYDDDEEDVEEDAERYFEESGAVGLLSSMEDDVDGEGHSVGETSDGDGDRRLGE